MRASDDVTYINGILTTTIKGLTSIELDKAATAIYGVKDGDYAFYNCKDTLQSFIIPEGSQLKVIQPYSFYKCSKLEQIDLSFCSFITIIGDYSFYECSSLRSVIFPESLISIEQYVFSKTVLEAIFIPKNVKNIGEFAFNTIPTLKNITFDENINITEISRGLFSGTGIISFTVPRYVSKIDNPFEGTKSLTEFKVQEGNENFIVYEKVLYNKNTYELIKCPGNLTGILKLHPECKKIGFVSCDNSQITTIEFSSVIEIIDSYSFQNSKIEKLHMPNTITTIGVQAFYKSNLNEITISNQIKTLSEGCFRNTKIETIVIPNGVTNIGPNCFFGCKSLREVQLPNSITNIGGGVFGDCESINVTFEEGSQFFISDDLFLMDNEQEELIQYLGSLTELSIPSSIKIIKKNSFANQKSITNIDFLSNDTLTEIEDSAFSNCELLQIINLPNSVAKINTNVFENCKSLKSIHFSSNLESLGNNCFQRCSKLNEVTFEDVDNELTIGNSCFVECSSLTNIKLPYGLISIGSECFTQCTKLNNIEIPSTLSTWYENAFSYSGLTSFNFPSDSQINEIPNKLFYSSSRLKYVSLSSSIVTIGAEAFALTALQEIIIPENIESIGNRCFAGCKSLSLFYVPSNESRLRDIGDYLFDDSIILSNITCNNQYFSSDRGVLYNSDKTELVLCPPASSIKYFSIPNTIKTISNSAFYKCKNVVHILIPDDSVETIGVSAFSYCSELLSINIPSCIKTIQTGAFLGCTRLRCGLTIDDSSINSQLISSNIPVRCIQKCPNTINQNCKSYLHIYILLYPHFYY